MDIEINFKTFVEYYRDLLIAPNPIRTWFYQEKDQEFTILIPEKGINVLIIISYMDIYKESPDSEKMTLDEILQKWREENLINSIPFKEILKEEKRILPKQNIEGSDEL